MCGVFLHFKKRLSMKILVLSNENAMTPDVLKPYFEQQHTKFPMNRRDETLIQFIETNVIKKWTPFYTSLPISYFRENQKAIVEAYWQNSGDNSTSYYAWCSECDMPVHFGIIDIDTSKQWIFTYDEDNVENLTELPQLECIDDIANIYRTK